MGLFFRLLALLLFCTSVANATPQHALALLSTPKYPPDFTHFSYANPQAPKGGTLRLHAMGTFDSLHPFILKGQAAAGLAMTFDTLMVKSADEPASQYGLIAESVSISADKRFVTFALRPAARFHDGSPITAADVVFTFNTLKTKGHPYYRGYFRDVSKAEALNPQLVRFTLNDPSNRELPHILGELPVLSAAFFANRDFTATTLEPIMGSGTYRVETIDSGRSISYARVPNYWAAALPVNVGMNNFDRITYDYYRDVNVALEAFKAGAYDFRAENIARLWAKGYDFPAVRDGRVIKENYPVQRSTGMQALLYNLRRPLWQEVRVRQALAYAFDFAWMNKALFHGAYTRTKSYFSNSELAATALPDERELALLTPWRAQLPPEVFTTIYEPPSTDGSGQLRDNLQRAQQLLAAAGWRLDAAQRLTTAQGERFRFEIICDNQAFERVLLPFIEQLKRLGIEAKLRFLDATQYQNRLDKYDYDMIVATFGQSLNPGNEQRLLWHSASADVPGGQNLIGIKNPVVDALVEAIISAPTRADLIAATRALDRVLLWQHYVIPQWNLPVDRLAYWDKFMRPAINPPYGVVLNSWWLKPNAAVITKTTWSPRWLMLIPLVLLLIIGGRLIVLLLRTRKRR